MHAAAASRYDPRLQFRVIRTPHFVIYFHRGEEALAVRLRGIVERVHDTLTARLETRPRGLTHVVLVDQDDSANGLATPYPYNTIELTAAAPTPGAIIGNYDDWLTLVFTHEYTHILHLDRSEGWAKVARHVLGRSPLVLPNLYLPLWQVEGLATFEESANTKRGRIPAGDFREIVDQAARAGQFQPLDRVNGGLIDWPGGAAHYAYGAYFHQYLADRFGEDKLAELGDATARRFPYTGTRAFLYVFGESLGDLWNDFERTRTEAARSDGAPEIPGRRLTHRGFIVSGPRFLPDAGGAPPSIAFSASDPHDFPALYAVDANSGATRRLTTRVGGDHVAVGRDLVVFDQLEVVRNVAVQGDLYAFDRRSGRVRRLTRNRRTADPDLSPDGRTLACILIGEGRRALALIDLNAPGRPPAVIASEPETQFAAPRWSPDGRTLAVERLRLSGRSQIVLVDVATRSMRAIVDMPDSRNVSPAWMPDGQTLVFASARGRDPFDIFAIDPARPDSLRRVTTTRAGATMPDVSADGRRLAYVGYTEEGYDVFTMPIDPSRWQPVEAAIGNRSEAVSPLANATADVPGARRYTPFETLVPRSWFPILEGDQFQSRIGAETAGSDVLGRHAFAAGASWWAAGERRPELQDAARPNWFASYVYDRWQPAVFVSASETDTLYPLARVTQGRTTEILERHAAAGVLLPLTRMRWAQTGLASIDYERDTTLSGGLQRQFERSAFRLGWAFSTAKQYGYSISSEQGFLVAATSEHVRRAIGADGDADAATVDARGYVRAGPRHGVVALRLAGGAAAGDPNVRREFDLGGSASRFALFDYGRDSISILRGFDAGTFAGRRLLNATAEYRVPVWRIERGRGTWPLFARTAHVAGFLDAGHAWNTRASWRDVKTSAGGELAIDLVAGYFVPITLAVGAARGWPGGDGPPQSRVFVRLGRAF
jgi:WD40 repeat protein